MGNAEVAYQDLGHNYFERITRGQRIRYYARRLAELGIIVQAAPPATVVVEAYDRRLLHRIGHRPGTNT
jgi:hypothetical protein